MRRGNPTSLHDKHQTLVVACREAEAEVTRLQREERYLADQVRQAQEQVRYYEGLLAALRRDWGETPRLARLFRKFG